MDRLLIVKGTLFLENIDVSRILDAGGEIRVISESDIPELIKGKNRFDAKVVSKSVRYRNLVLYDGISFGIYATEKIYINKNLYASNSSIATRSAVDYDSLVKELEYDIPTFFTINNTVINAPISNSDPYQVIGVGTYSGGYDIGYICSDRHNKTNKWAKYKPVRYNVVSTDSTPNWWKAQNGDCGLEVELNNYLTAYRNGTAYAYKSPRGEDAEPFRLCDFIGYDHSAEPFIKTHLENGFMQNINFSYTKNYRFSIEYVETSESSLTFSDLNGVFYNGIENVYLAYDVYSKNPITDTTAALKRSVVNEYNISSPQGKNISIDFDESDVGQTVYVLLYLKDPELPMTAPIPYDDNNYMLLSFKVIELVGLSGDMLNIAEIGQSTWFSLTGSVTPSNAYSTGYGEKEIQMQISLKNNNTSVENISNYNFRIRVVGANVNNVMYEKTVTPTFLNGMNGSPIYSLQIPVSQTVNTVLNCGKLFQEYINKAQSKLVNMYLEAKLTSSNEWYTIANRGLFIKE